MTAFRYRTTARKRAALDALWHAYSIVLRRFDAETDGAALEGVFRRVESAREAIEDYIFTDGAAL